MKNPNAHDLLNCSARRLWPGLFLRTPIDLFSQFFEAPAPATPLSSLETNLHDPNQRSFARRFGRRQVLRPLWFLWGWGGRNGGEFRELGRRRGRRVVVYRRI